MLSQEKTEQQNAAEAFINCFDEHFDNLSDDMQALVAKAVARQIRDLPLCKRIVDAEAR